MSSEQNKKIMTRMIEEVWNEGNLATADELFAPDHTSPSAPQLPPGSEGVKIMVKAFRQAMPDYHMQIDLMVADDNQVVGRFTQSGTHTGEDLMGMKASGRKATWTEIGVLRIKDDKIVQSWYEADMLSMIQQFNGTK
ncbi:MAG TPA: ester cyclase [Anaerolineaceae bacterium]|nr:ester cyclase [Anaerolineaceae bacterium]